MCFIFLYKTVSINIYGTGVCWKSRAKISLHLENVFCMSCIISLKPSQNKGFHQWRSQPENLVMLCKYFRVYRP